MNTLRQTCAATALSLLLAVSALAGQISSPGIVAPPPPSETSTSTTTDITDITTTIILTINSLIR